MIGLEADYGGVADRFAGAGRDFLAALERLTGRKAVNTGKVPTTVRYEL